MRGTGANDFGILDETAGSSKGNGSRGRGGRFPWFKEKRGSITGHDGTRCDS